MDMTTLALAKNYTDSQRLAHAELKQTKTFSGTLELDTTTEGGVVFSGAAVQGSDFGLVEGETYIVNLDGQTYECKCQGFALPSDPSTTTPGVGNGALFGVAEDTGEPFFIIALNGMTLVNVYGEVASADLSVTHVTETIHPIDPKFLPGVCLPVVELTTVPTADESMIALTADETTQLASALKNSGYAIVALPISYASGSPILMRRGEEGGIAVYVSSWHLKEFDTNRIVYFALTLFVLDGVGYINCVEQEAATA